MLVQRLTGCELCEVRSGAESCQPTGRSDGRGGAWWSRGMAPGGMRMDFLGMWSG